MNLKLCLCLLLAFATVSTATGSPAGASDDEEFIRRNRLSLDLHPTGYTLQGKGLSLDNLIPMHPAGFAAERFSLYPALTKAMGHGAQIMLQVTSAVPLGQGDTPFTGRYFYGGGIQKSLRAAGDDGNGLAVSIGGNLYTGAVSTNGQMGYVAASKRIWQKPGNEEVGVFATVGGKFEHFRNFATRRSGVRPFAGANLTLNRRVFLSGEYGAKQSWETATQWSSKTTLLLGKDGKWGLNVGLQGNGYRTYPTLGVSL